MCMIAHQKTITTPLQPSNDDITCWDGTKKYMNAALSTYKGPSKESYNTKNDNDDIDDCDTDIDIDNPNNKDVDSIIICLVDRSQIKPGECWRFRFQNGIISLFNGLEEYLFSQFSGEAVF